MAGVEKTNGEIAAWLAKHPRDNPYDALRKKKIEALKQLTGRPVLAYAADFLSAKVQFTPQLQSQAMIGLRDKDYLPDVTSTIPGDVVDLILQSPGGVAEAAETLVAHLRSRFRDIRVFVPGTAKSAATMLAMCANQIVMDESSELGPTDPQMFINGRFSPAGAILKQFELAQQTLKGNPSIMPAWLPVLQMYGPSLLLECQHHLDLSRSLVSSWLEQYMFAGLNDAAERAKRVAGWLAEDNNFLTHNRRVTIKALEENGVRVFDMGENPALQEAVRDLYFAMMATFDGTGAVKLVESSEGKTLAVTVQQVAISPSQPLQPGPPALPAPGQQGPLPGLPGGPALPSPPRSP